MLNYLKWDGTRIRVGGSGGAVGASYSFLPWGLPNRSVCSCFHPLTHKSSGKWSMFRVQVAMPLHTLMFCCTWLCCNCNCGLALLLTFFSSISSSEHKHVIQWHWHDWRGLIFFFNGMLEFIYSFIHDYFSLLLEITALFKGTRRTNITVTTETIKGKTLLPCCQRLCNYMQS